MARREDRLLAAILVGTSLAAFGGRALVREASRPWAEAVAPIRSSYGSDLRIEGDRLLIDLNTDSRALLMSLPGIGPALSERILDYRAEFGDFRELGDLLAVRGIGESTLRNLSDCVYVGGD